MARPVSDPDGAAAAGAIAGLSDGLLHYFLGGTAELAAPALAVQERRWSR